MVNHKVYKGFWGSLGIKALGFKENMRDINLLFKIKLIKLINEYLMKP